MQAELLARGIAYKHSRPYHPQTCGKDYVGTRVIMSIKDLDIRVLTEQGDLLRQLELDPTRDSQPTGRPPGPPKGRYAGINRTKVSTMP